MDPNAVLAKLRELMPIIRNDEEGNDDDDGSFESFSEDEAADAFEALDGWLSTGGFLPTAWQSSLSSNVRERIERGIERYEASAAGVSDARSRDLARELRQGHMPSITAYSQPGEFTRKVTIDRWQLKCGAFDLRFLTLQDATTFLQRAFLR